MNKHPLQMIVGTMLIVIFLFGYALKICERLASFSLFYYFKYSLKMKKSKHSPLVDAVKKNDPENWSFKTDISNYYNAIWCMVVTMATVGFGDFAPKTMPGRMLGFCICIYGVVGVSLMVLTLQNLLTLSFRENRVFYCKFKRNIDLTCI